MCFDNHAHLGKTENLLPMVVKSMMDSFCFGVSIFNKKMIVKKESRNGYARLLLNAVDTKFQYLQAKTLVENRAIASLFKKCGFNVEKTSIKGNILYWKKTDV